MSGTGKTDAQRQLWLLPEAGQVVEGPVADVAIENRAAHLYSYAVPDGLREQVRPGVYVRVPYGAHGRLVRGLCVRTASQKWEHTHKPVAEVLTAEPLLTEGLIELGLWISDYYVCPPGLTLAAFVPATVRQSRRKRVYYVRPTSKEAGQKLSAKQQALLDALAGEERRRDVVLAAANAGAAVLRALVRLGLVEAFQREELVAPSVSAARAGAAQSSGAAACAEDAYVLTPGQQGALDEVATAAAAHVFGVLLLYGVPGSGKTEVYVRAIRRVVAAGQQAILLVPEIALATQIVERLARRFERVAVLHGRLSARARRDTLYAVAAGAVDVIIGTRSAVFAPCPRLGLIVVDEEQDGSFKNMAAPYYQARDVAIKRAQIERIACVLGSGTPALETWHNAQTLAHYRIVRLPERAAGAQPPEVRLVEVRRPGLGETSGVLSPELRRGLDETLAAGQQAILLHNRRGYAVFLRCNSCGMIVTCPRCSARLVYHRADATARCHRCGVRESAPTVCLDSTCGGHLERLGLAIQRLEEELTRIVPQARLLRLDRDTMRQAHDYATALHRFEAGEADILLGTQMVAKGLDFPRVRLVGVIEADFALALPDFRAAEHVYQLITQVVGRAGRREGPSVALVQSADVSAAAIRYAVRMDYESFAAEELAARRRFFYPPMARMVRLILADARPGRARAEAERLAENLRELVGRTHPRVHVDEAGPCVIPRLRRRQRFEVIVRGPRDASVQQLLHEAAAQKLLAPRVQRFTIDVDPLELL